MYTVSCYVFYLVPALLTHEKKIYIRRLEVFEPQIKVISGAKFITDRHCPLALSWMFDSISASGVSTAAAVFFHSFFTANKRLNDVYLFFEWTVSAEGAGDSMNNIYRKLKWKNNNKQVKWYAVIWYIQSFHFFNYFHISARTRKRIVVFEVEMVGVHFICNYALKLHYTCRLKISFNKFISVFL